MSLSVFDLLTPARIALDLAAPTQAEAIAAVARLLASNPDMLDCARFEKEVLARERLSATAVGNGIAFPHARTNHVSQIVMAAARSRDGVVFEEGQPPVRLIFLIGTPNNMVREYLGLVGDLARRVKQAAIRDQLLEAATPAAFLAALRTGSKL